MITGWLQAAIAYLHHNPHSSGLIAFVIAFAEALAIIGTIVPGSVTMTAIGALIGSQVAPAGVTIACAVLGAVTGDFVSYLIGLYYKDKLYKIWPFTRYPHWLEKGELFFKKHGVKSIIIGRFFGPVRSLVPLIAGTFNMRVFRFLLAAIPSAALWAIMYLTPGILLGAISLELPPVLALHFISGVVLVIFLIILATWIIRYLIYKFAKSVDLEVKRFWRYLQKHYSTHWIISLFTDPLHPKNHRQLISAIYAFVTSFLFLLLLWGVYHHTLITVFNFPLYNLLRSLRNDFIDSVMILITMLGGKSLVLFCELVLVWLLIKRYWRTAAHWLFLEFAAVGLEQFFKHLFFFPRPGNLLHGPTSSSFPSGHTLFSMVFYGFLAVLISQQLKPKYRKIPYIIAITLGLLVAISRLFLGVHWFTDILGGILLATAIILLITISYRRGNMPYINLKQFITLLLISFMFSWGIFALLDFKKYKFNYSVYWPKQTISYTAWKKNPSKYLPLSRNNRFGQPIEAFNIEWLGDLDKIKLILVTQGWRVHVAGPNVINILKRLASSNNANQRIPLITELYRNKAPRLLMAKDLPNYAGVVFLKLWDSGAKIRGTEQMLFIGTVYYYQSREELSELKERYKVEKLFLGATKQFAVYLNDFSWSEIVYPIEKQPPNLSKLYWDGDVLLITDQR